MEWGEHSILSTHKLTAVLVVNISNVGPMISHLVKLLTENNIINESLLRNSISYAILTGIYYNVPNKANFNMLQAHALDNYYIGIDVDRNTVTAVNEVLTQVVSVIKELSYDIINKKKYTLAQEAEHDVVRVCSVSKLDLLNMHTIEFKFYIKHGGLNVYRYKNE